MQHNTRSFTYTSYCMQNPWTSHHQAYPWSASQVSICTRCIARCLLVPEPNKPDAQIDSFLCYLYYRYAHNAKQNGNTQVSKAASNYLRTCRRRHGVGL